ncbi:hypothetical protein P7C73_g1795, partial [Tremellales sp. Uapishka_1]
MESLVDVINSSFSAILVACVIFSAGYVYNGKHGSALSTIGGSYSYASSLADDRARPHHTRFLSGGIIAVVSLYVSSRMDHRVVDLQQEAYPRSILSPVVTRLMTQTGPKINEEDVLESPDARISEPEDAEEATEETPLVTSSQSPRTTTNPAFITLYIAQPGLAAIVGLFIGLIKPLQRVVVGTSEQGTWAWDCIGSALIFLGGTFAVVDTIGYGAGLRAAEKKSSPDDKVPPTLGTVLLIVFWRYICIPVMTVSIIYGFRNVSSTRVFLYDPAFSFALALVNISPPVLPPTLNPFRSSVLLSIFYTSLITSVALAAAVAVSGRGVSYENNLDLGRALKSAAGGGAAGAAAMVIQVLSLMPLRTIMNYQYRFGGSAKNTVKTLWNDGKVPRFYAGLGAAIFQGPLSRFGDTAANAGIFALLESFTWPVLVKTVAASFCSACFRMTLTPIDTLKTTQQTQGGRAGIKLLRERIAEKGVASLWYGALATAAATFVGHYPWFGTYNYLSDVLPPPHTLIQKLARQAFIGFAASVVSDTVSNSLRVVKTYRQVHEKDVGYITAAKEIIATEGVLGLFGRGLPTRLLTNGLQGLLFSVLWKLFADFQVEICEDVECPVSRSWRVRRYIPYSPCRPLGPPPRYPGPVAAASFVEAAESSAIKCVYPDKKPFDPEATALSLSKRHKRARPPAAEPSSSSSAPPSTELLSVPEIPINLGEHVSPPTILELHPAELLMAICRTTRMGSFYSGPVDPPEFLRAAFPDEWDLRFLHHCLTYSLSIIVVNEDDNPWVKHIAPLFLFPDGTAPISIEALKLGMLAIGGIHLSYLQSRGYAQGDHKITRAAALTYRDQGVALLRQARRIPHEIRHDSFLSACEVILNGDVLASNPQWREVIRLAQRCISDRGGFRHVLFDRPASVALRCAVEHLVLMSVCGACHVKRVGSQIEVTVSVASLSTGEAYEVVDETSDWWDELGSVGAWGSVERSCGLHRSMLRLVSQTVQAVRMGKHNIVHDLEAWRVTSASLQMIPRTFIGSLAHWHCCAILVWRYLQHRERGDLEIQSSADTILELCLEVGDKIEYMNWVGRFPFTALLCLQY